jgi:hypothetical protein
VTTEGSQDVTTCRLKRTSKRIVKAAAAWFGISESSFLETCVAYGVEKFCPEILEAFTPKRPDGKLTPPVTWRPNA